MLNRLKFFRRFRNEGRFILHRPFKVSTRNIENNKASVTDSVIEMTKGARFRIKTRI